MDTFEKQALGSLWAVFKSQAANAENAKLTQNEDWLVSSPFNSSSVLIALFVLYQVENL